MLTNDLTFARKTKTIVVVIKSFLRMSNVSKFFLKLSSIIDQQNGTSALHVYQSRN